MPTYKIREEDTSYWVERPPYPLEREFEKEFANIQDAKWWVHWQTNVLPNEYKYMLISEEGVKI